MIAIKRGKILKELFARPGVKGYIISIDGEEARAIVYPELVGEVLPGDEVLVNTTAVELQLGSGGYHYVIASLQGRNRELTPGGHIMKLRYTPMQLKVLSVEEEASPFHQVMQEAPAVVPVAAPQAGLFLDAPQPLHAGALQPARRAVDRARHKIDHGPQVSDDRRIQRGPIAFDPGLTLLGAQRDHHEFRAAGIDRVGKSSAAHVLQLAKTGRLPAHRAHEHAGNAPQ